MSPRVARGIAAKIPRLPFPPTVQGIAGCSGSGKTTLADELARTLGGLRFHLDDYYLDLGHLPLEERMKKNFDDPAMIEVPLLAEHVAALGRGDSIDRPVYDFQRTRAFRGAPSAWMPDRSSWLRGCSRSTIPSFRDFTACASISIRRIRCALSGGSSATWKSVGARQSWCAINMTSQCGHRDDLTVRPSSEAYVRPSAVNADLVIDGTGALDWKVERVMTEMRKRGLLTGAQRSELKT
jgi:uridine kinase